MIISTLYEFLIHVGRNFKQYLAVAPFPSHNHHPEIGRRASRPSPACIQIWSLSPSSKGGNKADDPGEMKCELIICIDGGPAHDLKWCPLPSHDKVNTYYDISSVSILTFACSSAFSQRFTISITEAGNPRRGV